MTASRCDRCNRFAAWLSKAPPAFQPTEWGRTQGEETVFWCGRCFGEYHCEACVVNSPRSCKEHEGDA